MKNETLVDRILGLAPRVVSAGSVSKGSIQSPSKRVETLEKLDSEASTYVESVIVQRTHFTGEYPYVGWQGLGLALNETLDELEYFKLALAVALNRITPHIPGDSRAVPDWFVACAAVQCEIKDRDGSIKACLEKDLKDV